MIPKEGGDDVFEGMHRGNVDDRLPVRSFQPDIIGRDRVVSDVILTAEKNTGNDPGVVYGKALNQIHIKISFPDNPLKRIVLSANQYITNGQE